MMARIRSIKPEFWTSSSIVRCPTEARLLFIGIWNFADDAGIHPDDPIRMKMEIFPGDAFAASDIAEWIDRLISAGLLVRYEAEGQRWLKVTGWEEHQRVSHPRAIHPPPPGVSIPEDSGTFRNGPAKTASDSGGFTERSALNGMDGNGMDGRSIPPIHPSTDFDVKKVRDNANMLVDKIDPIAERRNPLSDVDRELVIRAVIAKFAIAGLNPDEIADKIKQRQKGPKPLAKPWPYFRKALQNRCAKLGVDFHDNVDALEIPPELTAKEPAP